MKYIKRYSIIMAWLSDHRLIRSTIYCSPIMVVLYISWLSDRNLVCADTANIDNVHFAGGMVFALGNSSNPSENRNDPHGASRKTTNMLRKYKFETRTREQRGCLMKMRRFTTLIFFGFTVFALALSAGEKRKLTTLSEVKCQPHKVAAVDATVREKWLTK